MSVELRIVTAVVATPIVGSVPGFTSPCSIVPLFVPEDVVAVTDIRVVVTVMSPLVCRLPCFTHLITYSSARSTSSQEKEMVVVEVSPILVTLSGSGQVVHTSVGLWKAKVIGSTKARKKRIFFMVH